MTNANPHIANMLYMQVQLCMKFFSSASEVHIHVQNIYRSTVPCQHVFCQDPIPSFITFYNPASSISVSCTWMTDGYLQQTRMWVLYCKQIKAGSYFPSDIVTDLSKFCFGADVCRVTLCQKDGGGVFQRVNSPKNDIRQPLTF